MDGHKKIKHKDSTEFLEEIISEWRTVFDSITDLVSVLDTEYRFVRVNRPFARFLGVEPQELIGKKCHEVMHGSDRPASYCPISLSTEVKEPVQKEVYDSVLDRHFMINLSPILDENGKVQNIVHIMRDITGRKSAEKSRQESDLRLRSIMDHTSAVIYLKDLEGKYLMINKQYEELFHISNEDIFGKTDYDLFPREQADAFREHDNKVVRLGKSIRFDEEVIHDDGIHSYISVKLPLFDDEKKIYGICGISTDITDRRESEKELRRRERQLSESQRVARLGSWEWDIEKNLLTWSDELYKIFGVDPLKFEASFEAFLAMVHKDDRERLEKTVQDSIREKKPYHIDARMIRGDGSEWMMEARGSMTLDDQGNVIKIGGTAQNVTERKLATAALKESEERFRALFDQAVDCILLMSVEPEDNPIIVDVNESGCRMHGFVRNEIVGQPISFLSDKKTEDGIKERVQKVKQKGFLRFEGGHVRKDGSVFPVEVIVQHIRIGGKSYLLGIDRDITEKKRAESRLRESEEKYRKLVETANDAIFLADAESGVILDANKQAEKLLGLPLESIKGMHQTELHPPDERENYSKKFKESIGAGRAFISDLLIVHSSGRNIPVDISASLIEIGGRKLLQGVFRDISQRKKAEEDLIIKNRAIDSSLSAIGITDAEGNLLYVNNSLLQMWGYDHAGEMLGRKLTAFWEGPEFYQTFEGTLKKDGDMGEGKGKRRDGSLFDAQYSLSLISDNSDQPQYFFGSFLDITESKESQVRLKKYYDELELRVQERTLEIERANEALLKEISDRKEAEEALRSSEERFRAAATSISDLLWEGDIRNNSLIWHGDIDSYMGYDEGGFPRTITGHMDHIHEDDREWMIKSVEEAIQTGQDFGAEYRIRCKDGSVRYWNETGKAIEFENGKPVKWIGSVTDITKRKTVEQQVLQSEFKFKALSNEFNALLDAISDNILLLDRDMKIRWANRASARRYEKTSGELEGQLCYDLCYNLAKPCDSCPALLSFKTGKEETARRLSSSGIVWDIRTFPVKDDDGSVKNVIEVARDVTDRVKLEKEAGEIQSKLIHANKMTSLGTLVSGVAHELNNPNSFIMTNADLFNAIWQDAYKLIKHNDGNKNAVIGGVKFSELEYVAPKLLKGIYEGSGRIKKIVDNLRDFARSDRGDLDGKVDVNEALKTAVSILDPQIKRSTDSFVISCADNIPSVKGNIQQIEQVMINLIINSLQALPGKECGVTVSTGFEKEHKMVLIKVQDEGTGMSESDLERVTEPFFTTKIDKGGTGLGLSISYAIIKNHNGTLEFRSEKNKYTTACVRLPVFAGTYSGGLHERT